MFVCVLSYVQCKYSVQTMCSQSVNRGSVCVCVHVSSVCVSCVVCVCVCVCVVSCRRRYAWRTACGFFFREPPAQFQILRKLSQEPVDTAMPSSVTPRQLTRLSWPARTPVERGGAQRQAPLSSTQRPPGEPIRTRSSVSERSAQTGTDVSGFQKSTISESEKSYINPSLSEPVDRAELSNGCLL